MKPSNRILSGSKIGIMAAALCAAPILVLGQTTAANSESSANPTGSLSPVDVTPSPNGRGDGMYIPLTKNQPFKVKFNVEITKPLPDGSLVKQKYFVVAVRNNAGYEYRESRDVVPSDSDREPAVVSTMVYDPEEFDGNGDAFRPGKNCQRRSFDPTLQPAGAARAGCHRKWPDNHPARESG